jgi:hypothetical protein
VKISFFLSTLVALTVTACVSGDKRNTYATDEQIRQFCPAFKNASPIMRSTSKLSQDKNFEAFQVHFGGGGYASDEFVTGKGESCFCRVPLGGGGRLTCSEGKTRE